MRFSVKPAAASPAHAVAFGEVVEADDDLRVHANTEYWFMVQVRDAYDNNLTESDGPLKIEASGPGDANTTYTDAHDGLYNVSFIITKPGRYFLHLSLHGTEISNSPVVVNIKGKTSFLLSEQGLIIMGLSAGVLMGGGLWSYYLCCHKSKQEKLGYSAYR